MGSVARAMKNFGQHELALVNPPTLGDEAHGRAIHAWHIAEHALRFESLEDALRGCDYVIGTSARIPLPENTYLRGAIDVRDFPNRIAVMDGKVALLFGREDFGLFNAELELCDLLVTIPTSRAYPSLNLSQAVGIVLYELFVQVSPPAAQVLTPMSETMRRHFQASFDRLIEAMAMPPHREKNAKTMYRKLFGRAVPSAWEYFVLMGIIRRCLERFGIQSPSGGDAATFDLPPGLEDKFLRILDPES